MQELASVFFVCVSFYSASCLSLGDLVQRCLGQPVDLLAPWTSAAVIPRGRSTAVHFQHVERRVQRNLEGLASVRLYELPDCRAATLTFFYFYFLCLSRGEDSERGETKFSAGVTVTAPTTMHAEERQHECSQRHSEVRAGRLSSRFRLRAYRTVQGGVEIVQYATTIKETFFYGCFIFFFFFFFFCLSTFKFIYGCFMVVAYCTISTPPYCTDVDQTSFESKRTPRDFPRRLFLYPLPSAAARTAPNGVKERASFCLVFRSLNTTSSHRMFSMGYRRAKSTQGNTKFQKRILFGKQLRDDYPRALTWPLQCLTPCHWG